MNHEIAEQERVARRIRDALREEKHQVAVQIAERLLGGEWPTAAQRLAYRDVTRRLAIAHHHLIAIVRQRIAA